MVSTVSSTTETIVRIYGRKKRRAPKPIITRLFTVFLLSSYLVPVLLLLSCLPPVLLLSCLPPVLLSSTFFFLSSFLVAGNRFDWTGF